MDLQRTINSRNSGKLALQISRVLPPIIGLKFADFLAGQIAARRYLPLVRAIRLNRWVVGWEKMSGSELDQAVLITLRHIARSYYRLFHNANRPDALQKQVIFSADIEKLIASSQEKQNGVVVAGLHMSNFDLVLQAAAWKGLNALAISLPEETEHHDAVEWQHKLRRQTGLEILPASFGTFRSAIRRLRSGEIVLTGIDRPIASPRHRPMFFGRQASLPVHHISLALEADVPLVLFAAVCGREGYYQIHSTSMIQMRRFPDKEREIVYNAEQVLESAQDLINLAPEQWSVFQPVWPEALDEVP